MGGKRRRGSSTRKHKVKEYHIPASSPKHKKEKQVKTLPIVSTPDNKISQIAKFEDQIRSGVNFKGKPLTEKEIGYFLTAISALEHQLGIKHKHDSGIHSARHQAEI